MTGDGRGGLVDGIDASGSEPPITAAQPDGWGWDWDRWRRRRVREAHGVRRTYQRGCRCRPCRAANTTYHARLRLRKAKGRPLLGALVSAVEARRRIRQLKLEGYTETRIAQMAGWKDRHLQTGDRDFVRLKTLARIRRVATFAMLEGVTPIDDVDLG